MAKNSWLCGDVHISLLNNRKADQRNGRLYDDVHKPTVRSCSLWGQSPLGVRELGASLYSSTSFPSHMNFRALNPQNFLLPRAMVALTCSTLQWSRQWSSCLPGRSDEGPPHNSRERLLHGRWEENIIACLERSSLEWKKRSLSRCREAKQDVWAQLWYRLVLQHFSRILCFSCNTGTMHF